MTDISNDYEKCIKAIGEAMKKIQEADTCLPDGCGQSNRIDTALTLLRNAEGDLLEQYGYLKMKELMK